MTVPAREWLEWGAAERPMLGESVSGDGYHVARDDASALIVMSDGLGHGPPAAEATDAALAVIRREPGAALEALVERCHRALGGTRGVAITLVRIDIRGAVRWLGVGNVEALLLRARDGAREAAPVRGGAVGFRLPPLRTNEVTAGPGDLLVLATDGIASAFGEQVPRVGAVGGLARGILARHGKQNDDATVLVARFLGAGA